MPLSQDDCLSIARDRLRDSSTSRAEFEALCGLWLCYTYGTQWADVRSGRNQSLQQLRSVLDYANQDVRLCMNLIRARVSKINSRLMPRELKWTVAPASRAINDQVGALVGDARLQQQIQDISGLRALRKASLWRVVMGSSIIRRTISARGDPVVVRDPSGKPSVGPDGQERVLRSFNHSWAVCPPWEFIRDPSAQDVDWRDENDIGQEKPRPTTWLKRHYGIQVDSKATMGSLLEFQRMLYEATGQSAGYGWQESKTPAVLVSEWWFKDSSADSDNPWPLWMLCYREIRSDQPSDRELKVIKFGENPYYRLPLHHLWYDDQLLSPWGRGIAALTKHGQDALNIAFMSILRQFVMHGCAKYVIQADSLVDNIAEALTNRTDKPIIYRRGAGINKPERLNPAPMDQTAATILSATPTWLDSMLNMSPVQSGEAVKRGEPARAYEIRREAADTPLTAIIDNDEMTINELLSGTLFDVVDTESVEETYERLSHEFTIDQILSLKTQDAPSTLAGVKVAPDSLRPRTPQEMKDDYAAAVNTQMVDAISARRSLLVEGKVPLDVKEAAAYRQQIQEIQSLLTGESVNVYIGQDHGMHQWVIDYEQESARWGGYTEEQREAITQHWQLHQEAKDKLQMIEAANIPGAQPQPGQEQMGAGGMGETPMGEMPMGMPGMGGQQMAGAGLPPEMMPSAPVGAGW